VKIKRVVVIQSQDGVVTRRSTADGTRVLVINGNARYVTRTADNGRFMGSESDRVPARAKKLAESA
jgi:hypothetical protein